MFVVNHLRNLYTMLNRTLNRRNSKRFVIGDGEEENVTPHIEITTAENVDFDIDKNDNLRKNERLLQSTGLRQGLTLT